MAKESGLGWTTLSVDNAAGVAKDIRNDITNHQFATPRAVQDVTGIDKSAMERLLLLADASYTLNGVFNDAADFSHDVLKTVPSTSVQRTITNTISGQSLPGEFVLTDYALTRAQDGSLVWTSPAALANGAVPTWA